MTSKKHDALIVLLGGPHDGRTLSIASHDAVFHDEDGATYARQDAQQGDHRVYAYTTADGEALPTAVVAPVDGETTLERDMRELDAERKARAKK